MSSNYQVSEVRTRKRTCCQKFLRFLYDPDKKTFCTRTCLSWLSIIGFYIAFYAFLAGFFAIILSIYVHGIINKSVPMLTGNQSLLLGGPGVKIAPSYRSPKNESTLIYINLVNMSSSPDFQIYVNTMNQLFQDYPAAPSSSQDPCNNSGPNVLQPTTLSVPCFFDKNNLLGPCNNPGTYLQTNNSLCVFIRVNKIYGWLPYLQDTSLGGPTITCSGQNPADVENMGTPKYYPSAYSNGTTGLIPHRFFPYIRQSSYMTPIVAMELPQIKRNVVVLVQCQVGNLIINDGGTPSQTNFEIMVDGPSF